MNLGSTVGAISGAALLELMQIRPAGHANESAAFQNLWLASLVATILPVLCLVLLPWLIPDARQAETLLDLNESVDATHGSLLRRLLGTQARNLWGTQTS